MLCPAGREYRRHSSGNECNYSGLRTTDRGSARSSLGYLQNYVEKDGESMVKFRKNKAAQAMALLVTAGCIAVPSNVFAAGQYTPVSGTATSFDKYLVMDLEAEVPAVSFSYSITPGEARTWSEDGVQYSVNAGVGTPVMAGAGTDSVNTIAFAPGDGSDEESLRSESDLVKNLDTAVSKYAKKTAVIDFSGCSFTEPGIYRYLITESGSNQGVTNDEESKKILDVYVIDEEGQLKVQAYVLHNSLEDSVADGETVSSKPTGFTNVYDTSNLTIRKQVSGNQASRDKYFAFTLEIRDAQPGTVYSVNLSEADAVSGSNAATAEENQGKTNPSSLIVGSDGTVTQQFYLQDKQQVTICGLAADTAYTVTENAEEYQSEANTAEKAVVTVLEGTESADTEGVIAGTDLTTGYVNTRSGIIPTGIMVTAAPFAAVTLFGGLGAATIVMRRKKKEKTE